LPGASQQIEEIEMRVALDVKVNAMADGLGRRRLQVNGGTDGETA
jgi:hypothetical protein